MGSKIDVIINNQKYNVEVSKEMRLVDLLRDELGFLGTKEGCGEGICGACTVIMDGEVVNSCMVLAFQAQGSNIETIEGLETDQGLDPLQKAFLDAGAVQCGFCTPGMIMTGKALLEQNPKPSRDQVRQAISGNLCRCTGYNKVIDAIMTASRSSEKEDT